MLPKKKRKEKEINVLRRLFQVIKGIVADYPKKKKDEDRELFAMVK